MLIDNLRLRGREGLWQLRVADGRIAALVPMEQAADDAGERLDGAGGLAVPPFIEPHIHLDTTQTAGQPEWNRSGTLFEGIERWAQRKALLSHEDVKQRAWQTLKWQIANGVQHVRSHVDVSDPTLTALKAMLEVRGEVAPWVDLQIVAFPQEGILSYPNGLELLEESLRLGADVVGRSRISNSPASWASSRCTRPSTWPSATTCQWTHCDEIDDEQSRFLETLAMLAHRDGRRTGHRQPHHGDALLQRRLHLAAVPPAETVGNQLRRQPAGEHPPAGSLRRLPEAPRHHPGQGTARCRDQHLLRPRRRSSTPGTRWAPRTCCRCCTWACT